MKSCNVSFSSPFQYGAYHHGRGAARSVRSADRGDLPAGRGIILAIGLGGCCWAAILIPILHLFGS
jgi:hypothetical protein